MELFFLVVSTVLFVSSLATVSSDADHFATYCQTFDKQYDGPEEYDTRLAIFTTNIEYIHNHNLKYASKESTYWLAVNQFTDMTYEEFSKHRHRGYKYTGVDEADFIHKHDAWNALPDAIDWREKGMVTAVKNQAQCGSCWSFACTGSMEGAHAKVTNELIELSEQQLVDCVDGGADSCSRGGEMSHGFRYVIDHGAELESVYPYTATSGQHCRAKQYRKVARFSSFVNISQYDEQSLKSALAMHPTVAVAIDASGQDFQMYGGGVYDNPSCHWREDELDHGVLAVGYGTTSTGHDYWIVKNSWSASWGDGGYIKMARNKNNQCGIASDASYILASVLPEFEI